MANIRLDMLLTEKGFFSTREKAQAAIMAGYVLVNGQSGYKAGHKISSDAVLQVKEISAKYVSRGGFKLEKGLAFFQVDLKNKTVLDVGASTGGFTDCVLKHGASKVVSVDVGYGQLDWNLRNDQRVICLERTNIRKLQWEDFNVLIDIAVIDASFISLEKIFPNIVVLVKPEAEIIALIKPQFEAGKNNVGKNGVVKDSMVHKNVIKNVVDAAAESKLHFAGVTFSPLKGPKGNIEYLVYLKKTTVDAQALAKKNEIIEQTVEEAHLVL